MEFFDCNVSYGHDRIRQVLDPVTGPNQLQDELARAGVGRAVVFRTEQYQADPQLGQKLLAADLARNKNLFGLWAITPPLGQETPGDLLKQMQEQRMVGWRLFPADLRFLAKSFALSDYLELAVRHRVPIFISTAHGTSLAEAADLLKDYPQLRVVLTYDNVWPAERLVGPFLASFPQVYLDLAWLITAGGIESLVQKYGADRLLYGSGFPYCYLGATMQMIRQARLSEAEKKAIAAGNLERLLGEIDYAG